jgi:amino acid permease
MEMLQHRYLHPLKHYYYKELTYQERAVPKAIKQVFWRILLFYILAIFVIGMLIPYNSNALMGGDP